MAGIGKFKLSDAIKPTPDQVGSKKGGKPQAGKATVAGQTRASSESKSAKNAESSTRDRMVDIGRGVQQAGRQGKGG